MKEEQSLEDHLGAVQNLPKWELNKDLFDTILQRLEEKEQVVNIRWMAAASVLILLFSGMMIIAGVKKKHEFAQIQMELLSKNYAVNNLNY
jgi:TATA-box binding protein (TBP) (component of TFIID and TFIIIB)